MLLEESDETVIRFCNVLDLGMPIISKKHKHLDCTEIQLYRYTFSTICICITLMLHSTLIFVI